MSVPEKIDEILRAINALMNFMDEIRKERSKQPIESDKEAVAAKIIKEIKDDSGNNTKQILNKISECPCNQEFPFLNKIINLQLLHLSLFYRPNIR